MKAQDSYLPSFQTRASYLHTLCLSMGGSKETQPCSREEKRKEAELNTAMSKPNKEE